MPLMTTAEGYNPYGYYPGKKRSAGDYVKRVASLGAWSPDDPAATRANEMRTKANMQTQLEQENAMAKFQTAVDQTAQAVMAAHPDITKERATQMALEFHYNELAAADAKNKADRSGSEYMDARNRGKTQGAEALGREQTAANISQEAARNVQMQELAAKSRGGLPYATQAGADEALAGIATNRATQETKLNEAEQAAAESRQDLPAERARANKARVSRTRSEAAFSKDKTEFDRTVFGATSPSSFTTAVAEAEAAAAGADAHRNLVADRNNADRLARAAANKAGALQVPYGGTAVLPLDEPVEGQKHPAGPQNSTVITTDQFGNKKVTQKILGDAVPTGGATATNAMTIDPRVWTNLLNKYIPPTQ